MTVTPKLGLCLHLHRSIDQTSSAPKAPARSQGTGNLVACVAGWRVWLFPYIYIYVYTHLCACVYIYEIWLGFLV